jgi:hypothetical protein
MRNFILTNEKGVPTMISVTISDVDLNDNLAIQIGNSEKRQ